MALKIVPKPSKTSLATRPHNEERRAQAVVKTGLVDAGSDLKMFESRSKSVFEDIKTSFDFIQTNYSGVYIYTFEAESAATEITLN